MQSPPLDQAADKDTRRATVILSLAGVQGLALFGLHRAVEGPFWPATELAAIVPCYLLVTFLPLTAQLLARFIDQRRLWWALGISEATLRRARAASSKLDPATSDRLYRLSKVIAVAEEALETADNAMTWLRRPQPALGGQVPLELLVTHAGADEVETLLRRIDYGVYT